MTCKNCVHYEACLDWCRGFEEEPAKCEHFKDKSKFIELLSADVAPVRHGQWIKADNGVCYWYECSLCHERTPFGRYKNEWFSNYCPNCGARMDAEE